MRSGLGPVWMQSIFGVLEEYHGIAKYFHFEKLGGVWMLQTL